MHCICQLLSYTDVRLANVYNLLRKSQMWKRTTHDEKNISNVDMYLRGPNIEHNKHTFFLNINTGICLFLVKDRSDVDSYDCKHFVQGCPTGFYTGSTVYKCKYPLLSIVMFT